MIEKFNNLGVIIVAGGSGTRMGEQLPKQFLALNEKPVIFHTIQAFEKIVSIENIILVLPESQIQYFQQIVPEYKNLKIAQGGNNRFESVYAGLQLLHSEQEIVMIHDGVRPLVSTSLLKKCYEEALIHRNAIPALPVTDSIRWMEAANSKPIDRTYLWAIQTPQTFHSVDLIKAYQKHQHQAHLFTDDASVIDAMGAPIHIVEGEKNNIKITYPIDLKIAQFLLQESTNVH